MNENNVPAGMPLMCEAFRTCYSSGAGGPFVMEFKFKSLADLHAADDEWLAARATAPVAQPPATAEAVPRSKHLAWLRDQTDHWIGNRKARRNAALAALATQPPAPVQQTEAVGEERETESRRAHQSAEGTNSELWRIGLLEWGIAGWRSEVQNRPLKNIHRERLENFWRTVIRKAGGDPDTLVGPQEMLATLPAPAAALPPVARVPLTRERILALWGDRSDGPPTHQIISFARAVEASTGEQSHG